MDVYLAKMKQRQEEKKKRINEEKLRVDRIRQNYSIIEKCIYYNKIYM